MKMVKPGMRHFKEVMAADEAYAAAGEEPYCGLKGRAGYASWLLMLMRQAREDVARYGMNPNEIYLMVDDEERLYGYGQLRVVETDDVMTWAGHIGYSVPPDKRGRGCATVMLRLLLDMAFERGLERVLLTCDTDNEPSRRVIEKCGGVFDGYYMVPPYHKRCYWFYKDGIPDINA